MQRVPEALYCLIQRFNLEEKVSSFATLKTFQIRLFKNACTLPENICTALTRDDVKIKRHSILREIMTRFKFLVVSVYGPVVPEIFGFCH
jgi:hypothetical protein